MAAKLPVFREPLSEGSYQLVGPVIGLSCQITQDDRYRASEANAVEDLKREAFKAGGNAVMEVGCEALARGQGSRRCFRAIECRGIAVKTTPVSPP